MSHLVCFGVRKLRRKQVTNTRQETPKAMLSFSSHQHPSIFQREPLTRCQLLPLRQRQTAEHMQLGAYFKTKTFGCANISRSYQNGSILIASLQPRFTILHNLSTSRAPSPVVTLAWHASSSRQKSDMLATQTHDGDLRVWSIAKSPSSNDTAKVVRVLKRRDNTLPGPNWLAWSKNGRVIQYTEG